MVDRRRRAMRFYRQKAIVVEPSISVSDSTDPVTFSAGMTVEELHGIDMSPNGDVLYTISFASDAIKARSLATPWDISTLNATPVASFSTATQSSWARGLRVKPDLTGFFVLSGLATTNQYAVIHEYSMSDDVLTGAAHVRSSADLLPTGVRVGTNTGSGLEISADGTDWYVGNQTHLYHYHTDTGWDITGLTFVASWAIPALISSQICMGFALSQDGSVLLLKKVGGVGDWPIEQYTLSPAFSLTSPTYVESLSLGDASNYRSVCMNETARRIYLGNTGGVVRQYTLG